MTGVIEIKKLLRERVTEILKLEERVPQKREEMVSGDTSPFFMELFGAEMALLVKVGQSVQTTFGMSFYEQACQTLGETAGYAVETQKKVYGSISPAASSYLRTTLDNMAYRPNRQQELDEVRRLSAPGAADEHPDSTVDVWITTPNGSEFLIDITTVKPNKKEFRILKEKLLRWAAMRFSQDPQATVEPYIAIPYNPESLAVDGIVYSRHSAYYDRRDILVGDELWKKVSNQTFSIRDMVDVFAQLHKELKKDIEDAVTDIQG